MPLISWQYRELFVKDDEEVSTVIRLNELGVFGWEFTGHVTDTGHGSLYLMKRDRQWRSFEESMETHDNYKY